jgi:precorrin-2 dehydrogenase / sirohydrochlorin ferrochelatase
MKYYPVNLDIRNRNCLVVGGGDVGTRKVMTLLECDAKVTVVTKHATEKLKKLANMNRITLKHRSYLASDLYGMFMVIGATDDQKLNKQLHSDAESRNLLCNIADRPESCNFILPAIVNQGDLVISISTSGKSPGFAKKLRKDMEKEFGQEYKTFLQLMGRIREKLLSVEHEPEAHKILFEKLINSNLVDLIRDGKIADINDILLSIPGQGYDFELLMDSD